MYVKEVKTNGDLVCEPVPGGASLPTVAFSFADGFDASNNTWSRKTIDQTAQQICDRILGATWNGTKCTVAAGGGCQPQCPKANELCTGDSSYKSDGCGGFCNVTGTRECRVDCGEGGGGGATACTNPNSNETNFGNIGWEDCSHRCTWHFNRVKRKGCWIKASGNNICYCRVDGATWWNTTYSGSMAGDCHKIFVD